MSILYKCILSGTETKGRWDLFDQSNENEHVMFHYGRVALVSSFFKDAHKRATSAPLSLLCLSFSTAPCSGSVNIGTTMDIRLLGDCSGVVWFRHLSSRSDRLHVWGQRSISSWATPTIWPVYYSTIYNLCAKVFFAGFWHQHVYVAPKDASSRSTWPRSIKVQSANIWLYTSQKEDGFRIPPSTILVLRKRGDIICLSVVYLSFSKTGWIPFWSFVSWCFYVLFLVPPAASRFMVCFRTSTLRYLVCGVLSALGLWEKLGSPCRPQNRSDAIGLLLLCLFLVKGMLHATSYYIWRRHTTGPII